MQYIDADGLVHVEHNRDEDEAMLNKTTLKNEFLSSVYMLLTDTCR